MSQHNLFIIDDDVKLGEVLQEYLQKQGHQAEYEPVPVRGVKILKERTFDLLILDIMMPEMDGLEVCRHIRQFSNIPILFLSARGDTTDRIIGLELGADDYLTKPFEPRELLARIDSILRRVPSNSKKEDKALLLNSNTMSASLLGEQLNLTSMEFSALNFLVQNKHRIVSREDLINQLQGMEVEVFDRSIDILISRIRQKLKEDTKHPKYIKTIRGQGYRYIGDEE
ncbi:response regulator transcription factor [Bacteriovoracaceae bacterium]|nr:response regulator transcription factor [Bacteriovoracaceae bacterium]